MTTEQELKDLEAQLKALSDEDRNETKAEQLRIKIAELQMKKKSNTVPEDIGGQMKYLLEKYGLRTSFYCFIFAMSIILVGLLFPYNIAASIPGVLFLFDAGPLLLILYGVYSIPWIKDFLADEIKSKGKN